MSENEQATNKMAEQNVTAKVVESPRDVFSVPEPADHIKEIAEQMSQPVPEGQTLAFATPPPRLTSSAQATLNALRPKR